MNEEKQTLSTYVEPELAAAVKQEAEDKAVSIAAVIRWALMEYFDAQHGGFQFRIKESPAPQ